MVSTADLKQDVPAHIHSLGHRHVHARADVTDYVTDYVTVTVPEVVVWVDDRGSTVSIETRTADIPAPTPLSPPATSVSAYSAAASPSVQTDSRVDPSTILASFAALPPSAPTGPPTTTPLGPVLAENTSAPAPPAAATGAPSSALEATTSSEAPTNTKGLPDGPAIQQTSPLSE